MKKRFEDLDIKYYVQDQNKIDGYSFSASCSEFIEVGALVISTISCLITVAGFLNNIYGNNPNSQIHIQLFNKTVNNTYIHHDYKGDVNNFYNHEVEKMEDDFRHNGL